MLAVACDSTMTENICVENMSSITYYDENLPAMGVGRSIWLMSDNLATSPRQAPFYNLYMNTALLGPSLNSGELCYEVTC